MARYTATERIGINAVEQIVVRDLGWIFREQPIVDMGIDAQIELVDGGSPTGKLVAAQVKTGMSHFRDSKDGLIYYIKTDHWNYWSGHSLPVILVAHLPKCNKTYWVAVNEATVEKAARAGK